MDKKNFDAYYDIKGERENKLWSSAIFIFDTSTLLEFYYYPDKARKEILTTIFLKLKNRLWVTNHSQFEYLKNRESVHRKPYIEKYKKLEAEDFASIKTDFANLTNRLNDFFQKTSKKDIHPYIDQTKAIKYKHKVDQLFSELPKFEILIKKEFSSREKEIKELENDDIILKSFSKVFKVGSEYSIEELNKIINEGEKRFKHKIPPGYMDAIGQSSKDGFQKFGDLIIWKQIIDIANSENKDVIFITNDVKEDWCYSARRGNERRIEKPKEDLITEFKGLTAKKFWMYTFSQFLYKSNELLLAGITDSSLSEISESNNKGLEYASIRFEGIYQTNKISDLYYSYVRFMQDGTVRTASLITSDPKEAYHSIVTLSERPPTPYKILGNKIEFATKTAQGIVEYGGMIFKDRLQITTFSRINGNISEDEYFFIEVNDE